LLSAIINFVEILSCYNEAKRRRRIAVNDTSNRHQIMKDPIFWTRLAYTACGWLREADDKSLRRLWIDDFIPESATDTKNGVDIEGTAWVGDGPRVQHPYRFTVSIPQKMLHRRRDSFSIDRLILDETQQTLRVEIAGGAGPPKGNL
jgi:hypothetical protein